uniref:Uncharacterized protein LOC111130871 isoform X1 n=1 Tax=Crassostrea virginica TaxID=6565 RepID=A0A8B8E0S8_CRAVI|nr:uncharacterized protein LOC111130871 isoform X1 [Crassostrea virginica]
MATTESSQMSSACVMAIQNMSESVYAGLCLKIGTTQQVTFRRDIADITELLRNKYFDYGQKRIMESGSRREGFRLEGSDVDIMMWLPNHKVIWDDEQSDRYNPNTQALILCHSSMSPPGFTLLVVPLEAANETVLSSCVRINEVLVISSAKYREKTCTLLRPGSKVHGPCSSGRERSLEYDIASCFASDFWPPSASSWIDRCHSWPPPRVVDDIVRNGCHFVAIGHKLGKHVDNEWRISFSQAEQKLVYAMNHTQFLTYGLLKLFLKEFNNGLREEEKILCSYHMKTAVFWAIQQNTIDRWCPQNLLQGFWLCFKLLLKWVYEGVCPNFFIPENNMFLNNVYGEAQRNLFTRLYGLYEMGIAFLLQSPFIRSYIMDVLCNLRLSFCTDECALISEAKLDVELFQEILYNDFLSSKDLDSCIKHIRIVEQLIGEDPSLTDYQCLMLQKHTVSVLQSAAFILQNMRTDDCVNKEVYIADKASCNMLKLAAKFGFVSDLLYIAMYLYKTFRYEKALSVIEMMKVKLAQPCLMYGYHVDPERYTAAVGGQSWSNKMRNVVAYDIELANDINYIDELLLEQVCSYLQRVSILEVPPIIILHMLEFLCCRHVEPVRAEKALNDLQDLVHHDPGVLVDIYSRDISWEILGICQQITGNHQAALYCYEQSQQQYPYSKILNATEIRIQDVKETQPASFLYSAVSSLKGMVCFLYGTVRSFLVRFGSLLARFCTRLARYVL